MLAVSCHWKSSGPEPQIGRKVSGEMALSAKADLHLSWTDCKVLAVPGGRGNLVRVTGSRSAKSTVLSDVISTRRSMTGDGKSGQNRASTSRVEGDTSLLSHVRLDMFGESLPKTVPEACWKELEELSEVSPNPLETADPLARPDDPLPVPERPVAAILVLEIVDPRLVDDWRLDEAWPSNEMDRHSRSPATAATHCERE